MYQKNYIGREGQSNSLSHYKYISRKKVNGKWQYKYENPDEYDRNATVSKNVTTTYRNSNKLLDSTTKINVPSPGNGTSKETVIKERGKISQAVNKGQAYINAFLRDLGKKR